MNTLQKLSSAAAMGCLLLASPAQAAADGTLGMALMMAVVNTNGTLARGSGVLTTAKIGLGNYEVLFDRGVTDCAFVGSVGGPATGTLLGELNVAVRGGKPNGVFVDTNSSTGTATDKSFHLIVFCAK